jgi:hypothetical protein
MVILAKMMAEAVEADEADDDGMRARLTLLHILSTSSPSAF